MTVAVPVQVTFDCADADRMASFWSLALDYQVQPPPPGYPSWADWLEAMGVAYEPGAVSAVVDPEGRGPRIYFQRVPEAKQGKNRVHLDLNAGGGPDVPEEERRARVDAKVAQLAAVGGTVLRHVEEEGERWVVMQDPEGNEFCVQ